MYHYENKAYGKTNFDIDGFLCKKCGFTLGNHRKCMCCHMLIHVGMYCGDEKCLEWLVKNRFITGGR